MLSKGTDDLSRTVIILDDPNTSFDENRLGSAVEFLKDLLPNINQMIILTHYPNFVKRYFELKASAKLFKIQKKHTTSRIIPIEQNEICQSDHEKLCDEIIEFIERRTQGVPREKIRIFYENHIKIIFRKDIVKFNLESEQFGPLLKGLKSNGVLSNAKFNEMDGHRTFLNLEQHIYSTANSEEIRDRAEQVMELLFNSCNRRIKGVRY